MMIAGIAQQNEHRSSTYSPGKGSESTKGQHRVGLFHVNYHSSEPLATLYVMDKYVM